MQQIAGPEFQSTAVVVRLILVDAEEDCRRGRAGDVVARRGEIPLPQDVLIHNRPAAAAEFRMREGGGSVDRFTRVGEELSKPVRAGDIEIRMKRHPDQPALVTARAALEGDSLP